MTINIFFVIINIFFICIKIIIVRVVMTTIMNSIIVLINFNIVSLPIILINCTTTVTIILFHEHPHVTDQARASAREGGEEHLGLDQLHLCHGRRIQDGCGEDTSCTFFILDKLSAVSSKCEISLYCQVSPLGSDLTFSRLVVLPLPKEEVRLDKSVLSSVFISDIVPGCAA